MGKKNAKKQQKKERYERKDYSSMITPPVSNKEDRDTAPKRHRNNQGKERPAPVIPQMAIDLADHFGQQVTTYIEHVEHGDTYTKDLFVLENELTEGYVDYKFYVLTRNIRSDRETHLLNHGEFHAVVIDNMTNAPVYYINALIWKDLTASIQVTPIGENGPEYRNRARWTNRVRKTTEVKDETEATAE